MRKLFFAKKTFLLILAIFIAGIVVLFPTFFHGLIGKVQASGSINSISPNNGASGTTITVQGTGFGATLRGKITLGGKVVSNFYTDASENFTQVFSVPAWASSGATTILATNTFTSASIAFTVNTSSTKPNRVDPMCVASHLGHNSLTNTDIDTQLTLMQQAGIKYTRFDFYYTAVNPSNGVWDFSKYDNIVTRATAKGISVIAILEHYGVPTYLYNGRTFLDPMQPSEYATFTQAVTAHFAGQIPLYEMGNEPNGPVASGLTGMTSASYSALMKSGYTAIKAGDPNAKVISAGLAQSGGTGWQDPITYVQQFYLNGAKGSFDYLGMHPYSQPQSPDIIGQTSNSDTFNIVSRLKRLMEKEGDRTKQIMLTEVGWPTTSDFSSGGVTQATQATYISRIYTKIMHEDYQYVPIFCMYDFVNDGTVTTYNEDNFGALNTDYTQKPSYSSLATASADFSSNFTAIAP